MTRYLVFFGGEMTRYLVFFGGEMTRYLAVGSPPVL